MSCSIIHRHVVNFLVILCQSAKPLGGTVLHTLIIIFDVVNYDWHNDTKTYLEDFFFFFAGLNCSLLHWQSVLLKFVLAAFIQGARSKNVPTSPPRKGNQCATPRTWRKERKLDHTSQFTPSCIFTVKYQSWHHASLKHNAFWPVFSYPNELRSVLRSATTKFCSLHYCSLRFKNIDSP